MFCSRCGRLVSFESRFCNSCGSVVSQPGIGFVPTPTGSGRRLILVIISLFALLIAIGVVNNVTSNSPESATTKQSATTVSGAVEDQVIPMDERKFLSVVRAFQIRYRAAPNEFQKSALRRERAAALANIVPSFTVEGWTGRVSAMEITSDGKGILAVRLPGNDSTTVRTWNNGLSDIGSGTLIPQGSALYERVANLAVGDKVSFDGIFASGNLDFLRDARLPKMAQ